MIMSNLFNVNKTHDDIISLLDKVENRFLIKKNNKNTAKIYFDYDDNTRLEIISTEHVYRIASLAGGIITDNNLIIVNLDTTISDVNGVIIDNNDDIILGSIITDGINLGIINKDKNGLLYATIILSPEPLKWNEL